MKLFATVDLIKFDYFDHINAVTFVTGVIMDQMMRNQAELKKLSERQPHRLPPYKPLSTSAERHYEYLEGKLLETRVELSYWREKCKELLGQQADMKTRLEQREKFKDGEKERLLERIAMLEQQNERLRRKDSAESQGFQTQLSLQRQKLLQLEKTIMKVC